MQTVKDVITHCYALHERGDYQEMLRILDDMFGKFDSVNPSALYLYAVGLAMSGCPGMAKQLLLQLVDITPDNPGIWQNLGVTLRNFERFEDGQKALKRAYELNPERAEILYSYGATFINAGNPKEAEKYLRRAIEIAPDHAGAHMNLALSLLEQERYEEAWPHWVYRWQLPERTSHLRPFKAPRWDGKAVGTLAIHGEQGLGDEILFMSVFKQVRPLAAEIIVEANPQLCELFARSLSTAVYPDHDSLIKAEGEPDAFIPMGDLFGVVGLPDGRPYLSAIPALRRDAGRKRVGIAWKGGLTRTFRKHRSLNLEQLKPILETPGIEFVSLQHGPAAIVNNDELKPYGIEPMEGDFNALISRIASCDLIITPCQTNVHIAGALGIPAWVMTPKQCAWRYTGSTERMPFWNSVKLYRQDGTQMWNPVIQRIAGDLRKEFV